MLYFIYTYFIFHILLPQGFNDAQYSCYSNTNFKFAKVLDFARPWFAFICVCVRVFVPICFIVISFEVSCCKQAELDWTRHLTLTDS